LEAVVAQASVRGVLRRLHIERVGRRVLSQAASSFMEHCDTREPRSVCERCRRPQSTCYCAFLPSLPTDTKVVVLQHPRERDMSIGTARMAHLCLPNSELHVGVDWERSAALHRALSDPTRPAMLLYPSADALDIGQLPERHPMTLVVVDGTWANAKKMVKQNPILTALPRVAFQPPKPSEYRIRREPKPHCVSTVEALAHVLGVLEGQPDRFTQLLEPFRRMIDRQIELKELNQAVPCRHAKKVKRPVEIPTGLRERAGDIVCVVGEANAWPYCAGESRVRYPDELVHWVAFRLATGESFDCVARPRAPLALNTAKHIELSAEALNAGGSIEELCAAWQRFVRTTDVLCSWGCYATSLLTAAGGFLPPERFDLRWLSKSLLKRKLGSMDQFLEGLEGASAVSLASGRAGARLGQLVQIAKHFSGGTLPV